MAEDNKSWVVMESTQIKVTNMLQANKSIKTELYDSGASRHMSPFWDQFITYQQTSPRPILAANKQVFYAVGTGDFRIQVPNGVNLTPIVLWDALHAPEMGLTVVSVGRIANAGYSVAFEGNTCKIKNRSGTLIGSIPLTTNNLYKVEQVNAAITMPEQVDLYTLHCRLGHIAPNSICKLVKSNAITGIQLIDEGPKFTCPSCEYAKATRKPIRKECIAPLAGAFGDEIHTDLWGPSLVATIGGRKYYVTFTDDHTRYTTASLLRTKDQALQAYKAFANWAQTQHRARIKRLHSDRGGEYMGNEFTQFLQNQGTEQRLTTHDTPQHNGIAESLNWRILEHVHAMLHHAKLPKSLWGEAVLFAVWLKNRTTTKALRNMMPFEKFNKFKPDLSGVPEWGQQVWAHSTDGTKLDA